jgi:hypothetical protein
MHSACHPRRGAPYLACGFYSVRAPHDTRTDEWAKHRTTPHAQLKKTYGTKRNSTTPYDTAKHRTINVRSRNGVIPHANHRLIKQNKTPSSKYFFSSMGELLLRGLVYPRRRVSVFCFVFSSRRQVKTSQVNTLPNAKSQATPLFLRREDEESLCPVSFLGIGPVL